MGEPDNETIQNYNKGIALADCTMSDTNGGSSMLDPDYLPGTLIDIGKPFTLVKTVQSTQAMLPIDLTDGLYHELPIAQYNADLAGKINTPTDIGSVPYSFLMGLNSNLDYDSQSLGRSIISTNGSELRHWNLIRLKQIRIKYKNINLFVERDTSGGIQILDDLIFQVRKDIADSWKTGASPTTPVTMNFNLADMKRGWIDTYNFTQFGWMNRNEGILWNLGGSTPNQYVTYYPLRTYVNSTYNTFDNQQFTLYCNSLPAQLSIRIMNFGTFTNVKVFLSYVMEIETDWDGLVADQIYSNRWFTNLQLVSTTRESKRKSSKVIDNDNINKKNC